MVYAVFSKAVATKITFDSVPRFTLIRPISIVIFLGKQYPESLFTCETRMFCITILVRAPITESLMRNHPET